MRSLICPAGLFWLIACIGCGDPGTVPGANAKPPGPRNTADSQPPDASQDPPGDSVNNPDSSRRSWWVHRVELGKPGPAVFGGISLSSTDKALFDSLQEDDIEMRFPGKRSNGRVTLLPVLSLDQTDELARRELQISAPIGSISEFLKGQIRIKGNSQWLTFGDFMKLDQTEGAVELKCTITACSCCLKPVDSATVTCPECGALLHQKDDF